MRKVKRIGSILLAAVLFLTLFAACGKDPAPAGSTQDDAAKNTDTKKVVSFVAKSANVSYTTESQGNEMVFYTPDISSDTQVDIDMSIKKELEGKTIRYTVDGEEFDLKYNMTYDYPDGTYCDLYLDNGFLAYIDSNGKMIGFQRSQYPLVIDATAFNTEQRKTAANKLIYEYLELDLSDWSYTEENAIEETVYCHYKKMINGKNTGKRCTVIFNKAGEVTALFCQSGINLEELKEYPDFDRDECFEAAKAKLVEKLNQGESFAYYSDIRENETYVKLGEKLYYRFDFKLWYEKDLTAHTYSEEDLPDSSFASISIYVELVTE